MSFVPLKDLGLEGRIRPETSPNWVQLVLFEYAKGDFYLLWSLDLGAPVGNFMTQSESNEFIIELGISLDPFNVSGWSQPTNILKIIAGNKAGVNGETITWNEILELYK